MSSPSESSQPSGKRPVPTGVIVLLLIATALLFLVAFLGGGRWMGLVVIPLALILFCLLGYVILVNRLVWHTLAVAAVGLAVVGYFKVKKAFDDQKEQISNLQARIVQTERNSESRDVVNFNSLHARLIAAAGDRLRINGRVYDLDTKLKSVQTRMAASEKQLTELSHTIYHVHYKDAFVVAPPTRIVTPAIKPKSSLVKALIRVGKFPARPNFTIAVTIDGKPRAFTLNFQSRITPIAGAPLPFNDNSRALLRPRTRADLVVDSRTNTIKSLRITKLPPLPTIPRTPPKPRKL